MKKPKVILNTQELFLWFGDKDMTYSEFADAVGISRGYLSELMNAKKQPSPKVRRDLLRVTKLLREELFTVSRPDRSTGGET